MKVFFGLKRLFKIIRAKDLLILKQFKCSTLQLGNHDATWTINPDKINSQSVIYSFGIGEDNSWEIALLKKFNLEIFAFDPTPKSIEWLKKQNLPQSFKFYPIGIASYNGVTRFEKPMNENYVSARINSSIQSNFFEASVKTLKSIMQENNHKHIDVLKMDIESAEYSVIDNILKENISVDQILVEFHHRFKNVGISKTRNTIRQLKSHGYKIFFVSDSGEEVSFIKSK